METKPEQVLQKGLELHHYANTAYPLDHSKVWKDYRASDNIDSIVRYQWADVDEQGMYVHIPFCKNRCLYCEYTVLSGDDSDRKDEYIDSLVKEIGFYNDLFRGSHKRAVGLDIGGGTPTVATVGQLSRILDTVLDAYDLTEDFGISIETTPLIANDYQHMKAIRGLGIKRISMGMQTIDTKLLQQIGRIDNGTGLLKTAAENVKRAGYERFNIDLMYGFRGQPVDSFLSTIGFALALNPDYITLYRNRYKGTRLQHEADEVTLAQVNELYDAAFDMLNERGFFANFGKNTFSRFPEEPGTSAYLTRRVVQGTPYLGMGLGAQTMASGSLYYNQGAASKKLNMYQSMVQEGHFPIQDLYVLPDDEMIAKMISVSFYFGYINKPAFERRFGTRLEDRFSDEMDLLRENGLMEDKGDLFQLTKKGKDSVNGIIPLFYSKRSKENLLSKVVKDV